MSESNKNNQSKESKHKSPINKNDLDNAKIVEEELDKKGMRQLTTWQGPLPQEVIKKISPDVANEMVRSLCRRQEKQNDIVEKIIDSKSKSESDDNAFKTKALFVGTFFILALVTICLLFNNSDIIKEVFQIAGYIGGGSGIAVLILKKNLSKSDSDEEISIDI